MNPLKFQKLQAPTWVIGLGSLVVSGCANPVVDDKIDALGPEVEGVEASEFHRPGQPCVLCHSVYEGADPLMVIGGTVFADQRSFLPVEGAEVVLYDTYGKRFSAVTNCMGNFFLPSTDADPLFPLAAEVRCPEFDEEGNRLEGYKVRTMNSWISRDGSCASCHSLSGTQVDSTGWVFCNYPDEIKTANYPEVRPDCPGVAPKEKTTGEP